MKKINPLKMFYKEYLSQHNFKLCFAFLFAIAGGINLAYGPKKIGNLTSLIYEGIIKKIMRKWRN